MNILQIGKRSNISFGYKLTPRFIEDTRWNYGCQSRNRLLHNLKNLGNDSIIIDTKLGGICDNKDYDIIIFPKKYHFKKRIYNGGFRNYKIAENIEKKCIEEILYRAAKRGNLEKVSKQLLTDFPNRESEINAIMKSSVFKETVNAIKSSKNIFKRIIPFFK